jgi:hypothetical protein
MDDRSTSRYGSPTVDDVVEKVKATARDVQSSVADLAGASNEAIKTHASHAIDAAKEVAASAQDRLQGKLDEQKGAGADYVKTFAGTLRRAASQFDDDAPAAGEYVRKAANQLESAADAIRNGDVRDLVQGVQNFARSQPTAFFGLAFLAGFGAVRFLKSAAAPSGSSRSDDTWRETEAGFSGGGSGE